MRGVEAYHASKGWSAAPGYQWVVFDSGRIYEGVGWGRTGVHTAGYNSVSIAFCFGNDGDAAQPTEAAWRAASDLRAIAVARGALATPFRLTGHRDHAAKSCPGNRTYPRIGRIRTAPPTGDDDMLRTGDAGNEVGELQQDLNRLVWTLREHGRIGTTREEPVRQPGWYRLKADENYGAKTVTAVAWAKQQLGYRGGGNSAPAGFLARLATVAWANPGLYRAEARNDTQSKRLVALEGHTHSEDGSIVP